jgi:hypothetical protein
MLLQQMASDSKVAAEWHVLMFTAQLYRSKQRSLSLYRERVTEHSRVVEKRWLERSRSPESAVEEVRELTELSALGTMFTRIETMRVVPFDLRSFGQLLGSSLGSIAVLLPLLHANAKLTGIFDAIGKLLGHLAGHERYMFASSYAGAALRRE